MFFYSKHKLFNAPGHHFPGPGSWVNIRVKRREELFQNVNGAPNGCDWNDIIWRYALKCIIEAPDDSVMALCDADRFYVNNNLGKPSKKKNFIFSDIVQISPDPSPP